VKRKKTLLIGGKAEGSYLRPSYEGVAAGGRERRITLFGSSLLKRGPLDNVKTLEKKKARPQTAKKGSAFTSMRKGDSYRAVFLPEHDDQGKGGREWDEHRTGRERKGGGGGGGGGCVGK